jgi:hypothetical protein
LGIFLIIFLFVVLYTAIEGVISRVRRPRSKMMERTHYKERSDYNETSDYLETYYSEASGRQGDSRKYNEHFDEEHDEGQYEDEEHDEGQYEDEEHDEGQYEDEEHDEGQYEDEEHDEGQYEDEEHDEGQYEDEEHDEESSISETSLKKYYEVLEISENATADEIKNEYRRLSIQWHPDRHRSRERKKIAEKMMKEINEAYEMLEKAGKVSN